MVLLDQLARLLHGDPGIRLVLGDQLELAAQHAALLVQLLHRQRRPLLAVLADGAEESRERDQLADADRLLRVHDRGNVDVARADRGGRGQAGGQELATIQTSSHRVTSRRGLAVIRK